MHFHVETKNIFYMAIFWHWYCGFIYILTRILCFLSICESKNHWKKINSNQYRHPSSQPKSAHQIQLWCEQIGFAMKGNQWTSLSWGCSLERIQNRMHFNVCTVKFCKGLYDYFLRFLVNKRKCRSKSMEQVSPQFSHKWRLWQELLIIGFISLCTTTPIGQIYLFVMTCIWTWQRMVSFLQSFRDIVWFLESNSFSASSFGSHGLGERLGWKAPR